MISSALYRFRRGLATLRSEVDEEGAALAPRYLSPKEHSLFRGMSPADQRHSLRVLRALLQNGPQGESLLKAALLHDIGKSRCRINVLHRTAAVLLKAVFGHVPAFITVRPDGRACSLPLFVIANHARIGANMLAQAGTEERVWRLVELHHLEPADVEGFSGDESMREALALLRQADNQS